MYLKEEHLLIMIDSLMNDENSDVKDLVWYWDDSNIKLDVKKTRALIEKERCNFLSGKYDFNSPQENMKIIKKYL